MSENIRTGFQEALGIPELAVTALRVEGQHVWIEAAVLLRRTRDPGRDVCEGQNMVRASIA